MSSAADRVIFHLRRALDAALDPDQSRYDPPVAFIVPKLRQALRLLGDTEVHDYGDPGPNTGHGIAWCFTHACWENRITGQEAVDA